MSWLRLRMQRLPVQLPSLSDSLHRLNSDADPAPHTADAHIFWQPSSRGGVWGGGGVGATETSGPLSFLSPAHEPAAHKRLPKLSEDDSGGGGVEHLASVAHARVQQGPGAGGTRRAVGGGDWGAGAGGALLLEALGNQHESEGGRDVGQKRARATSEEGGAEQARNMIVGRT